MARKHEIAIASETGAFEKGIKSGVIEPLGDAEKALKDLGDTNVGREIDRDLEIAQKSTKKLESETKDAANAIEDAFRKSYRKVKDDADDATDKMRGGFDEAADEAKSSGREAAASFSGEFDDVADFVQETLANALGGFGPLGAAAGLAAAAGLGIAMAKITELQEKVEELQQVANDVHLSALEEGLSVEEFVTGVDGATAALSRLNEEGQKKFRYWWEEDQTGLQEFNEDLQKTGEAQADALDILQLSTDQMEDYRDAVKDNARELRDQADAIKDAEQGMGTLSDADLKRIDSLNQQADAGDRVVETLEKEIETRSEAAERSDAWATSGAEAAVKRAEAEKTAAEERATAEEEAAGRIRAASDSVVQEQLGGYDRMRTAAYEKATADDAAFDVGKWLDYVEQTRVSADAYRENLQTMKLTPGEWENLLALPEEARGAIVQSYATSGEEGRTRIRQALGDGGAGEAGQEATVSFSESFNPEADVEVTADTSKAEQKLVDVSKKREAEIAVKVTGLAEAERALDDLAKRRDATIRTVVDSTNWDKYIPATKTGTVKTRIQYTDQ